MPVPLSKRDIFLKNYRKNITLQSLPLISKTNNPKSPSPSPSIHKPPHPTNPNIIVFPQSNSLEDLLMASIYNIFMEQEPKVPHSPLSTHRSESAASTFNASPTRQLQPRFSRSGSRSRSKIRQDTTPELSSRFLLKRQEQPLTSPRFAEDPSHGRYLRTNTKTLKRQDTPCKSRRSLRDNQETQSRSREGDLEWVNLQRQCHMTQAQNLHLQKTVKSLQNQVGLLQERITVIDLDRAALRQKLSLFEGKEPRGRDRGKNLMKLKHEISKQRHIQTVPAAELLKQQLDQAQTEMNILRDSLKRAEQGRGQAQRTIASHRSEREHFLQGVIQQLRQEASTRSAILQRIKIQLNVLRIRQAKQEEQLEQRSIEQLQNVKKKYGNVLKKYHQASQQLAVYRRREQRANLMDRFERNCEDSLSLSP